MLADLPIDPNVIIVFGAVIFAAIKAFLEKRQQENAPPEQEYENNEEEYPDLYQEYEAELERQRQAAEIVIPPKLETPPPIPVAPPIIPSQVPKKPTLSAAEKTALENFQNQNPRTRRSTSSTKSRVMKQLASPTAAREALLLAEILGPPKAMRPEENT